MTPPKSGAVATPESGAEDAAILLMTLGEENAASIFKYLSPKEVQKLGETIARMKAVTRERVDDVLERFARELRLAVGVEQRSVFEHCAQTGIGLCDQDVLLRAGRPLHHAGWAGHRDLAIARFGVGRVRCRLRLRLRRRLALCRIGDVTRGFRRTRRPLACVVARRNRGARLGLVSLALARRFWKQVERHRSPLRSSSGESERSLSPYRPPATSRGADHVCHSARGEARLPASSDVVRPLLG